MVQKNNSEAEIAKYLLETKAVSLQPNNPFKWSSGWNSPIYCDNRVLLSYPKIRSKIKSKFIETARSAFEPFEAVSGVATAGIAHATLIADSTELPLTYVRSSGKKHGTKKRIEGKIEKGQKVLVVEDLISTGKSSLSAIEALREEGVEVVGLIAIFTYGFDEAANALNKAGVSWETLSNYQVLVDEALAQNFVDKEDLSKLNEWRLDPSKWK